MAAVRSTPVSNPACLEALPLAEPRFADPSTWRFLLFGVLLIVFGSFACVLAGIASSVLLIVHASALLLQYASVLILGSSTAVFLGVVLTAIDLLLLLPLKRQRRMVASDPLPTARVTAVLTAYNDAPSIAQAVRDFLDHPAVARVIVVDNNSTDSTAAAASAAGAIVVAEPQHGYGHCVYRGLCEGVAHEDTSLTLLCEGDLTFRASDIDKFLAYIPHAAIVNGTRIVEQLRDRDTQLSTFMFYGNFVVGKLLEAKYVGQGTFTDVGTTYKLCRNGALRQLLPKLNPRIDLEFNAHFLDRALRYRIPIVECPITFHKRVGISKGGNASNGRALSVGLRMIAGLLFSWGR